MRLAQESIPEQPRRKVFVALSVALEVFIEHLDSTALRAPQFVSDSKRNQLVLTLDVLNIGWEACGPIKFDAYEFLPLWQNARFRCEVVYRYPDVSAVAGVDM